jgi:3-hydroxyisobutyrate dehydrogenase-like beta-hydroxyacid dehydrogenase
MGTPFLQMKRGILAGDVPPPETVAASLATVRKDMLSIAATAALAGVPTPAAAAALASFSAACAAGWSERELAEIVGFYRTHMPQK